MDVFFTVGVPSTTTCLEWDTDRVSNIYFDFETWHFHIMSWHRALMILCLNDIMTSKHRNILISSRWNIVTSWRNETAWHLWKWRRFFRKIYLHEMDELQFRRVNMLSNAIISRESSAAMEIFFKIERDSQSTIESRSVEKYVDDIDVSKRKL